jgi:hypothetical protein
MLTGKIVRPTKETGANALQTQYPKRRRRGCCFERINDERDDLRVRCQWNF